MEEHWGRREHLYQTFDLVLIFFCRKKLDFYTKRKNIVFKFHFPETLKMLFLKCFYSQFFSRFQKQYKYLICMTFGTILGIAPPRIWTAVGAGRPCGAAIGELPGRGDEPALLHGVRDDNNLLREALCTLVRTKLDCQILSVRSCVRPSVRSENNHFLGRGYEGGTHPSAYR